MTVRICPKCEINFIRDDEAVCQICKRELKKEAEQSILIEMCSSCGEHPCEPGEDLCIFCLNERKIQDAEDATEVEPMLLTNEVELGMDEIDVPANQDIPDTELRVIHEELGVDDEEESDLAEEEAGDNESLIDIVSFEEYDEGDDDDDEEDENY